jgi:hypothetical protein
MHTRRAILASGSRIVAASLVGGSVHARLFGLHCGAAERLATDRAAHDRIGDARISFTTADSAYQSLYDRALNLLAANLQVMHGFDKPVLIEGSVYRGIWLECGPQEGLVYSLIRPDVARNNHAIFFDLQQEDGQIPCSVKQAGAGFGQIQMVVPIAATAWELTQATQDSELLENAYRSCGRWDAWLRRYRDTRHTGLCEGFCTYDTGHDNSPRWAGIPNRCPDADARKCPPIPSLPRLCPDLSATVYGGRVAMAAMARALGKTNEADRWLEDAAAIRTAILKRLYDPDDAAFYDLDAQDHFVRIRGDLITRVLGEHVVDQRLFETIYRRQIHNPHAFWAPYPFPSIALDDPSFVRPIPRNSWGGAAQALTALRAPRWMEPYGKPADLSHLMQRWITALLRASDFRQQMDPLTGVFTLDDPAGYSPAALVFLDFTWRLAGVRTVDDMLEWNIRPAFFAGATSFRLRVSSSSTAEVRYDAGSVTLLLNGRELCRTRNEVRLRTGRDGVIQSAVGIAPLRENISLEMVSGHERTFAIEPNSTINVPVEGPVTT